MKCAFCGKEFAEETATANCTGCVLRWLRKDCGLLCCPHCGYAMPREPRFIRKLRAKWEENDHARGESPATNSNNGG